MRSLSLLVSLLIAAHACAEQRDEKRPDGTLSARYNVDASGQRHGLYQAFSANGKNVIENVMYMQGKPHGVHTLLNDKGEIISEKTYILGRLIFPKGQTEIKRTLAKFEEEAKASAKETTPGKGPTGLALPSPAELANCLARVKTFRYLCDVPYADVVIDADLTDLAQHAAEVCAALGGITHNPTQPAGMDDAFFKRAHLGCQKTNLSQGSSGPKTVDRYMFDSDPSNIKLVGHRRWVINPAMKICGFGIKGAIGGMTCHDQSREKAQVAAIDSVCYPPRGYMPLSQFNIRSAWHYSPNAMHYEKLDPATVKATIWPLDETFKRLPKPLEPDEETVSPGTHQFGGAVIFRPKAFMAKAGAAYEVEITGIKKKDASAETITYIVSFF